MTSFSVDEFQSITRGTLGRIGEAIAARYIERNLKWQILMQNWSCQHGELDLIVQDGEVVVIVEVRTRRGANALELALASVNQRKQEKLMMLADLYRDEAGISHTTPIRIDVVGIAIGNNGLAQVEMVQDAVGW